MHKQLYVTSALALVLQATVAIASDWRPISQVADGQAFIDTETVQVEGAFTDVWVKKIVDKPKAGGPGVVMARWSFNCSTGQVRVKHITLYNQDGSTGTSMDNPAIAYQDIEPDSLGQTIQKIVCAH